MRHALHPVFDLLLALREFAFKLLELRLRVRQLGLDEFGLELWMGLRPSEVAVCRKYLKRVRDMFMNHLEYEIVMLTCVCVAASLPVGSVGSACD